MSQCRKEAKARATDLRQQSQQSIHRKSSRRRAGASALPTVNAGPGGPSLPPAYVRPLKGGSASVGASPRGSNIGLLGLHPQPAFAQYLTDSSGVEAVQQNSLSAFSAASAGDAHVEGGASGRIALPHMPGVLPQHLGGLMGTIFERLSLEGKASTDLAGGGSPQRSGCMPADSPPPAEHKSRCEARQW